MFTNATNYSTHKTAKIFRIQNQYKFRKEGYAVARANKPFKNLADTELKSFLESELGCKLPSESSLRQQYLERLPENSSSENSSSEISSSEISSSEISSSEFSSSEFLSPVITFYKTLHFL